MSAENDGASASAPGPPVPGAPVEISDPLALRALAHPARIAILEYLVLEGPATATQCAEIAGLSPTACSYHLRALAKYGFVEEDASAAVDGRHRPWRAKVVAVTFGEKADTPPAVRAAGRAVRDSLLQRVAELRDLHYEQERTLPLEVAQGRRDQPRRTARHRRRTRRAAAEGLRAHHGLPQARAGRAAAWGTPGARHVRGVPVAG